MVWSVCRRALADPNDAEDAFQVTFLVLARRARSIAQRELLPNWLHGVAVRTAKELKAKSARRRQRAVRWSTFKRAEIERMYRSNESIAEQLDSASPWVDEELAKLPEIFRAAIVLCDLEGKTQEEAARQLGVPQGTVASRLVRGREKLRRRLTRRGYTVSPGLITAALSCEPGDAGGPLQPDRRGGRASRRERFAERRGRALARDRGADRQSLDGARQARGGQRRPGRSDSPCGGNRSDHDGSRPGRAQQGIAKSRRSCDAKKSPDALAWVDDLHNADAASKQRLKRRSS